MKTNGFTLIELVLVITLLAIFSVSVVPKLSGTSDYQIITHRDNLLGLLRTVQQRAMQNTQADTSTCHRVRFEANKIGLSNQASDGSCGTGILNTSGLDDYLLITDINYSINNGTGYIDFDSWGRPLPNGSQGGSRITIDFTGVCIEPEGYIHVCP